MRLSVSLFRTTLKRGMGDFAGDGCGDGLRRRRFLDTGFFLALAGEGEGWTGTAQWGSSGTASSWSGAGAGEERTDVRFRSGTGLTIGRGTNGAMGGGGVHWILLCSRVTCSCSVVVISCS